MTNPVRKDLYSELAVLGIHDFELRGSGLAVPLSFKPDAAFIVRTVLEQKSEFTGNDVVNTPGFKEICGGTYPPHRFVGIFSDLRFTLNALGSSLILQAGHRRGNSNVYLRNPDYSVVDKLGLLVTRK